MRIEGLLAPAPEDLPGCHKLLYYAGSGEVEEAAAVGELLVFLFYDVRAEQAEVALKLI